MTIGDADVDTWREFCKADDIQPTRQAFQRLCEILGVKQGQGRQTYTDIKDRLSDPESKKLWTVLDKRQALEEYRGGAVCNNQKVLVIGAGPCGLRMAIETAFLGAHTVVVEARDTISRNNVLHLWQFVIQDLKMIGIKFFHPRFAVGSLDHVSIRRLQLCLLKIALVLGVEIHCPVLYNEYVEPDPSAGHGWRVQFSPASCPAAKYNFDFIVGADGKKNSLPGYKRTLMRGKLAIAISANFVNRGTREDSRIQEIGGLFYVFDQQFFNQLQERTGVQLENFVYFKDETHYFVMTPTKKSLLKLGVLRQDFPGDVKNLLSRENVDREKMLHFSKLIARESTQHQLQDPQFARNHHDEEDVAIFDFTAMYQAQHSCYAQQRHGHKLLTAIVGDTLIEPFWPSGSGCARGFLGVYDAAWLIRNWCLNDRELEVIAERENVYTLLSQSSPTNLKKPYSKYTIDPTTRYVVQANAQFQPHQVAHLYVSDVAARTPIPKPRVTPTPVPQQPPTQQQRKRTRGASLDTHRLRMWYQGKLESFKANGVHITDLDRSWRDGLALCALVQLYRPGLIDVGKLDRKRLRHNVSEGLEHIEQEFGVSPLLSANEWSTKPDKLAMVTYLSQLQEALETEAGGKMPRLDGTPDLDKGSTLERQNAHKVLLMVSRKHAVREQWKQSKKAVRQSLLSGQQRAKTSFNELRAAMIMTVEGIKRGRMNFVGRAKGSRDYDNVNPLKQSSKMLKISMKSSKTGGGGASKKQPALSEPQAKPQQPRAKQRPPWEQQEHVVDTAAEKENYIQKRGLSRKHAIRKNPGGDNSKQTGSEDVSDAMKGMSLARQACVGVAGNRINVWQQQAEQDNPQHRRMLSESFLACRGKVRGSKYEEEEDTVDAALPEDEDSISLPNVRDLAQKIDKSCDEIQQEHQKRVEMGMAGSSDVCCVCGETLYITNRITSHGYFFHSDCYRCATISCRKSLRQGNSVMHKDASGKPHFYCFYHGYDAGAFHAHWEPKQDKDKSSEENVEDSHEEDQEEDEVATNMLEDVKEEVEEEELQEQEKTKSDEEKASPEQSSDESDESDDIGDDDDDDDSEDNEDEVGGAIYENVPHFLKESQKAAGTKLTNTLKKTTLPRMAAQLKNTISARLLQADTIQRGFDDIEDQTSTLTKKGLNLEEIIRKDGGAASDDLLNQWLEIVQQQQELKRRETELLLKVRLAELKEQHLQLQVQIAAMIETEEDLGDLDQLEKEVEELEGDMNAILIQMKDLNVYVKAPTASKA